TIVDFGKNIGVYALVTNQGSQMAMVWDQRIGTDAPSNLYYAASIDGGASWQTSNEKLLALPMTASIAETVIRSQEPLFAWDVVLDKNQRPITVYTIGTGIKNRYGYVRWNGKRWVNEIVTSSRLLYGGHNFYAGGVVIDPTNPARVLLSKQRTKKELEVWSRTTTGWARSLAVTGSSKIDNFRPQFVMNDPSRRLVWAAGIYDGLQNNNWTGFGRVNIFSTTMK
ncbi:MAG: BNR-4 repeat-containing protein, partial [Candidatus Kerfeldbacteria bacterium]|nr:BNR-4 repeat-containing protein [Candidatus Kerfeldbacteria bacterium]